MEKVTASKGIQGRSLSTFRAFVPEIKRVAHRPTNTINHSVLLWAPTAVSQPRVGFKVRRLFTAGTQPTPTIPPRVGDPQTSLAGMAIYILSHIIPWNASYSTPDGQVIYRIQTSSDIWRPRKAVIEKAISNKEFGEEEQLTRLGEIEFHVLRSSKITLGDVCRAAGDIFRKRGLGCYGRDRIFQGPDGTEYRWELGPFKSRLWLNDGSKTIVAKYHQDHYGLTRDACSTSLEIFPIGEHITDLIIVTFVYIEFIRLGREEFSETF
ncbi:hypothetical protein CC2G_006509 [Coprinopsis cinerea AmutBmut pab1-1]|nr:hypothetical protein CC2G_006509 [Coprinopsis cinerea AmutBmut pab1-1]